MKNPPSVAAIVLNYNGREVTLLALESLLQMQYPDFQVVVVDNGSTDDSEKVIGEAFPEVPILRTDENLGPAGGANLGLRWSLEEGFDFALVLNNDIEVDPRMLSELVEAALDDERIGCVGPKELYHGDRQRIWSAGGMLRFREAITNERGCGQMDVGQFDETLEVDYINGCAMLIRSDAVRRTGPMDRDFHLGVEDADFCTRMKALGYRCLYAPQAVLWHMVAYTAGVYTPRRTFFTARSTALYVRRHANAFQWASSLLFIVASLPIAFVRELLRGNQAAVISKVRGFWEGFRIPLGDPPTWDDDLRRDS